jgi:hypothetical protein
MKGINTSVQAKNVDFDKWIKEREPLVIRRERQKVKISMLEMLRQSLMVTGAEWIQKH